MTALQKASFGAASDGSQGDTVYAAFAKMNSNTAVLQTQATLVSSSPTTVRALTAADMGTRVNFTPSAASTVALPAASACGLDQVVMIHNLSATYALTVTVGSGSGDTAPGVVVINPNEAVTYETDGVSVWRSIARKKSVNEVVQGTLTVTGGISGYSTDTTNAATYAPKASPAFTGNATFATRPTFNGGTPWDSANLPGSFASNVFNFTTRPTFATATPWDSTNLPSPASKFSTSMVSVNTANGVGSTNTAIPRFSTVVTNVGSDITYTDSATAGASFTINTAGIYAISYSDNYGTAGTFGITLNSSSLTSGVLSSSASQVLACTTMDTANYARNCAVTVYLAAGSVIRAHGTGSAKGSTGNATQFCITRVV